MSRFRTLISLWLPPLLWMCVLFAASATPSQDIPTFGGIDTLVKKGGHMLGYAVLALLFRRALGWESKHAPLAWLLAVLYAVTDEFHQTFVPGRHPAWLDVLVFDGGGAALALWLSVRWSLARRSESPTDK
jgi:VanZ family protein